MHLRSVSAVLALTAAASQSVAQVPDKHAPAGPDPGIRTGLSIEKRVRVGDPFTVAGPRGVLLGQQEGTFEAWVLPVKLFSHFTLRAEVQGYPVPIELNDHAAEIQVFPDRTVITYAHLQLTVKQTMFAPEQTPDGTGAVVLFEVDAEAPVDLTFSFTPEMRPMWPEPSKGNVSPEWVADAGAYLLHTDYPDLTGAVTIPGAKPGILAPYQEKPHVYPLELKLHVDPKQDRGKVFPLLMAMGQTTQSAAGPALFQQLQALKDQLPAIYTKHVDAYARRQESLTAIQTPDESFNENFRWAELAVEQLRARAVPGQGTPNPSPETGLVAGYFSSGDSARPGFGWYFGRDTLYTLYAVNGMGDFPLTRDALSFLMERQRADGKVMHEYSQTAAAVDWKGFPYQFAAADATPLFLLAMLDYVQASGDVAFLQAHQDAVLRAWQFESTHDSDGDGIYDNAQGTGWVENWPGGLPHQEIYLALLDRQASSAMASLASMLDDPALARKAGARAATLAETIEREYYQPAPGLYAFSRNANGSLDGSATLYPALAWWSEPAPGLKHAEASLRAWDSHAFSTDWGTRDVSADDPNYDPASYHSGSVWPLFTGWAAIADYRSGRPLSGYAHLRQNADQTTTQDLGAVTELLSGDFFTPFGRSTSHQLWSSAMVITPTLRGLFGLTLDAASHTITVDPHLPADWPSAQVKTLHLGSSICDLSFVRRGEQLAVSVVTRTGPHVKIRRLQNPPASAGDAVMIPLPPVEVALPQELPLPGSRTHGVKVLAESRDDHSLTLELEGDAGTSAPLSVRVSVRINRAGLHVQGEGIALTGAGPTITGTVTFPAGTGYQKQTIRLRW